MAVNRSASSLPHELEAELWPQYVFRVVGSTRETEAIQMPQSLHQFVHRAGSEDPAYVLEVVGRIFRCGSRDSGGHVIQPAISRFPAHDAADQRTDGRSIRAGQPFCTGRTPITCWFASEAATMRPSTAASKNAPLGKNPRVRLFALPSATTCGNSHRVSPTRSAPRTLTSHFRGYRVARLAPPSGNPV
jgi:hypothetical protein